MTKRELKVGDSVGFKFDVEQGGKIEKISRDWLGRPVYHVRAFEGGYVDSSIIGTVIEISDDDIIG